MNNLRVTFILILSFLLPQAAYSDLIAVPREDATTRIYKLEAKLQELQKMIVSNDQKDNQGETINELKKELDEFKKIILKDPKSALSFQQLKSEIDFIKKENQQIRRDISGYMGLSKWFIGSLVTLSIAIIGLLVMVMFREVKLTKIIEKSAK